MKKRVTRISVLSVCRIAAVLSALMGLFQVLISLPFFFFSGDISIIIIVGMIIGMPIVSAIAGVIMGALGTVAYNLLVPIVGGFEVKVTEPAQP